jgi:hypothetical protein
LVTAGGAACDEERDQRGDHGEDDRADDDEVDGRFGRWRVFRGFPDLPGGGVEDPLW